MTGNTGGKDLLLFLQSLQRSTRTGKGREALEAWIGDYYGKILQFIAPGGSIHAVFTRQGMRIQEGRYPAPDLVLTGDAVDELAQRRFDREAVKDVMRRKRLQVRGNLHEAFALAKLAETALRGDGK